MLFECCDGPFCSVDSMDVREDKLDVDLFRMYFSTAAEHSLSITFSAGWYPPVLRVVITSLNAVTMDARVGPIFFEGVHRLHSCT